MAEPPRGRRHRLLRLFGAVVGIGLAALAVNVLLANKDELVGAFDTLSDPSGGWLAIAIGAELGSFVLYALAERVLLRSSNAPVGLTALTGISIAVQALGNCLPGGQTVATLLGFRELQRRRVDEGLAPWMIVVVAALFPATLAILAVIGVQVAGGEGPASGTRLAAYALLGVLALLAVVGAVLWRRGVLDRAWRRVLRAGARSLGRRRQDGSTGQWRLGHVSPGPWGWAAVTALLAGAWLADCACLAAAFAAVGAPVPWRGLLLAYCAGQLAALLPITPGGLGLVEGSLTLALVAYGGGQEQTLAAVLLYRLVSFWGVTAAGVGAYAAVRATAPRRRVEKHVNERSPIAPEPVG